MTSAEILYQRGIAAVDSASPDGQTGLTRSDVTAGKFMRLAFSLFLLLAAIALPVGGLWFVRAKADAAQNEKLSIGATATAYWLSLPTPTPVPTFTPAPRFVADYREGFGDPSSPPDPRAGTQATAPASGASELAVCVLRMPFIYDSGSEVSIVGCGDQFCSDAAGNLIPRNYLQCPEEKYPGGAILLPTGTPLPLVTPTPLVKWKVVQATCEPCLEVQCEPTATTRPPLASDQIEVCWHVDGIRGLWVDGQGVSGHDCRVFGIPYEGGNEVEKWIPFKVQR